MTGLLQSVNKPSKCHINSTPAKWPLNKHTDFSGHCYGNRVSNKKILKCLWHCCICTCLFVCMHVCVYACSLQSFCTRASEDFCILSLARITEENKHCLYYSNEYGLGNKLYNFPLTPTHPILNAKSGSGKPVTFDFAGTKHCSPPLLLDPWPLTSGNS